MAVNVSNNNVACSVSQFDNAQALFDFICPKLCNYFNDYLILSMNVNANLGANSSGVTNINSVINQLRSYVNAVVEFYNCSQSQAIGLLYNNCTQQTGLSYQVGCKVRPNTSTLWNDILGQAPSNQAGQQIGYIEIIVNTNNLSDLNFVTNTNITLDQDLSLDIK